MEATINAHSPNWPPHFRHICSSLDVLLPWHVPVIAYSHIGSTAVPSLSGQSIVDILVTVRPADLEATIIALTSSGKYEQSGGERATVGTVFSALGDSHLYEHSLYVCGYDSLAARVSLERQLHATLICADGDAERRSNRPGGFIQAKLPVSLSRAGFRSEGDSPRRA